MVRSEPVSSVNVIGFRLMTTSIRVFGLVSILSVPCTSMASFRLVLPGFLFPVDFGRRPQLFRGAVGCPLAS
jgi:hypothetical protein